MFEHLEANYLLGDVLGRGGMGIVYSATQRALNRQVAVKIPHPELARDPMVVRRFRIEALAGARLTHKNIARVIDFGGGDKGAPYIVMERVPGRPLDTLRSETGVLETSVAVELACQILAALEAAHGAGVIHADIKTANVLVETLPDGVLQARVIDFGLARFVDEPTQDELLVLSGTPDYLAPELIRGGLPSIASDIYAAGVVLYELLTGTTPFGGGSSAEIMNRQLEDPVVPPSLRCPDQQIPPAIEVAIMRALEKQPSARFADASEFSRALRVAGAARPAPRLARGTEPRFAFSTEATTRSWARERPAQEPVAIGRIGADQEPVAVGRIGACRRCVNAAVAQGDGDAIVTAYLELARALIDGGELAVAATELEHGLAVLRPATAGPLWRLQLCLAALYSGLGDPIRAKKAATLGADDAGRAASKLGQDRATNLLARLSRNRV